jgi:tRNA (guanine37-N1)-methyltransferase
MQIDVVTIFPGMLGGFLNESIMKRAVLAGKVKFGTVNPRDFTSDRHKTVDDRPYGGGPGMVMMAPPLFAAVESVRTDSARVVLLSPQGRQFSQRMAGEFARCPHLVFVCGHYEGVDERVREALVTDEVSIGDYVLTNGTLAATVVIDAVVRLIPGVLGADDALESESFSNGLLEYPQYTRPDVYRGIKVPEVLLSGDHAEIARWRAGQARQRTMLRRPDLQERTTDHDIEADRKS